MSSILISSPTIILENDMILDEDYQETIVVPDKATLIVKGITNRFIRIDQGGCVIVEGQTGRINCIGGKILIKEKGFVSSLYCANSVVVSKGKIHEVLLGLGALLSMSPYSESNFIDNQNSNLIAHHDTIIHNYHQTGIDPIGLVSESCYIEHYSAESGIFEKSNTI
jgi:hypothetical protein